MSAPLFVQARDRTLGPVEIMDSATLDWIRDTSAQFRYPLKYVLLNQEELRVISDMCPESEWFYSVPHIKTIHGISHCLRVMLYGAMLGKMIDGNVNRLYIMAAAVHDVRRLNDNEDGLHGNRAAEWFGKNRQLQKRYELGPDDINIVQTMITWHQIEYENIDATVLNTYRKHIDIIKAADALDRFRMPKESWWPQPDRISLKEAHGLLGFCRELTLLSEADILKGQAPNLAVFNAYDILLKRKDTIEI